MGNIITEVIKEVENPKMTIIFDETTNTVRLEFAQGVNPDIEGLHKELEKFFKCSLTLENDGQGHMKMKQV